MHDHEPQPFDLGAVPGLPAPVGDDARRAPGPRRRRPATLLRAADLGSSPGGSPSQQNTPADNDRIHSEDALSGAEAEVEPPELAEEPSDPEEAPNTPLAEEKRAVVVYAARNLTNTIDIRPVGTAWFSA